MDCPHIPVVSLHEFAKRIHDKATVNRTPISGTIELTFQCNLSCRHCYIPDKPPENEISCREICRLLDEIADAGCLWLLITGGEPFVREDWMDIYAYAKEKGLIITLFTNGTLITAEIADYLAACPPFATEITLYGITEETYEGITRVKGSYKRCIQGIELLADRRVPFSLKTMVITLNKHELAAMRRYAEELGVEFRFDPILNPGLDGSKRPCGFRISPEEVIELDLADEKRVNAWREFCDKFSGPPQSDTLYVCGAGLTAFHVDPYGALSPCMMSRSPTYDLRKGSFHEGWYDFIPEVIAQRPQTHYECGKCDLLSLCGQCPGWAQLENGDQEKPVEYLCRIAHLRADRFSKKPSEELVQTTS